MKKFNLVLLAVLGVTALHAAKIDQVIVRQQWPWSTDVKVEYRLLEVDAAHPVDLALRAYNGDVELPLPAVAITGDRYGITDAVGTFVIDPVKAFGTEKVALANFKVKLTVADSPTNINEVVYKIVQLDPPYAITDVTRADLLNGNKVPGPVVTSYSAIDPEFSTSLEDVIIWTGVTNEIYKTDYIVFRRIPAAGKHYMMGQNNPDVNGGAGVDVSFKRDFYIGVFELTQRQVERFSHRTSLETNPLYAATRPADRMYFSTTLRGTTNSDWPEEGCMIHTGFSTKTLLYDMQAATGLLLDLPTEAMWEFACRGGTTSGIYTGGPDHVVGFNAYTKKIMRAYGINGPASTAWPAADCDLSEGPLQVGSLLPNAYGLYDMLGNIKEWCLDKWCADDKLPGGEDPVGLTAAEGGDTSQGVMRGGSYRENPAGCHTRLNAKRGYNTQDFGARLCIYLDNGDDGRK